MHVDIGYVPHLLNFVIYMWVFVVAGRNFWFNSYTVNDRLRVVVYAFIGFQLLTVTVYLFDQSMRLLEDRVTGTNVEPSAVWLLHDYLNGIFHLAVASLSMYYIKGLR